MTASSPAPQAPSNTALERMLKNEDTVSNLLAFLTELDPQPLAEYLKLPLDNFTVHRETNLAGKRGRTDFLVHSDGIPRAVFEIKVGADEHGDQLARYEKWAAARSEESGASIQRFVVDLMAFNYSAPDGWASRTLSELVGLWSHSTHNHARWMADSMRAIFDSWVTQLESGLGAATTPVVAYLAVKQSSATLLSSSWRDTNPGLTRQHVFRDNGGNAASFHYLPHPNGSTTAHLSLDIRAGNRKDPSIPWNFRLGVEATQIGRPLLEAQSEALELATDLRPMLLLDPYKQFLKDSDQGEFADVLTAGGHNKQGLPRAGFYHDLQKTRLSSLIRVNMAHISVAELVTIKQLTLKYLWNSAQSLEVEG